MHFRRTSNKRKIRSELKTKHVRRRIDETKTSIEIERIAAEIGFESLGQNDLEDITGADVILGSFHRTCELVRLKIAVGRLRFEIRSWSQRKFNRFRECVCDSGDRCNRSRIDLFG